MTARFVFAAALALLARPALAQDAPGSTPAPPSPAAAPVATPAPTPPAPAPKPATVRVALQTAAGPIVLELEKERAPITTANFLRYVDGHRLDGATFYRAVKVQDDFGLVQGGIRNAPAKVLPPIKHEPTTKTGLTHTSGTISMARLAPGTATIDFFITVGDQPTMDADPKAPGDNLGFAAFGHVVEGMEIVKTMLRATTAPGGPKGMEGQMLAQPVRILSAKRVD